jgi:CMP-N,N'-diacetyllegionaminic acid synthase
LGKIKKNFWVFIPARSGSKGLKNKNIINLKSHPLIGHTILIAKKIKLCEKICFSTDSKLYLKKANQYKINETYVRPKNLSKDLIEDKDVIIDYFKKIKKNGDLPYAVIFLRATNPIRNINFINRAVKKFLKLKKYDSLCSVEKLKNFPQKYLSIKNKKLVSLIGHRTIDETNVPRQILDATYKRNGHVEIFKTSNLFKYKNIYGFKSYPLIDITKTIDIDSKKDLSDAKKLL